MRNYDIPRDIDWALCSAAMEGATETVVSLIGAGADIHRAADIPLADAAHGGHCDTVRALLAAGADRDIALFEAAMWGLTEIVTELCATGVDVNRSEGLAMRMAAVGGHSETVKALLAAGATSNAEEALFNAAGAGHTDTVLALLRAGAQGHAAARRHAEENGHAGTARFLRNWRSQRREKGGSATERA
jgi:ankyrin repeat protein